MSDNKPKPEPMLACRGFAAKLKPYLDSRAESEGELCQRLGLPRNKMTRWRDGHQVFLDHAWLVVRALKLESMWDYLIDDRQTEPPMTDPAMMRILAMVEKLGPELAEQRLLAAPERDRIRPRTVKRNANEPADRSAVGRKRPKRRTNS